MLTLVSLKLPEVFRLTSRCCGVVVLGSRPRSFSGHSILMISAPNAPSQRVAQGPARTQLKSTTRIPARAFMRETPSSADVRVILDLLTPHLQRQPLVCGGAQQAGNAAPPLRPLSLASAAEYRSGIQQGRQPMTDLPKHVDIHEEGPREGFQIEPGPISTADKIRLIEALAETGLHHIQAASFVSPKIVPGWADAEDVVAGFTPKEGVTYTGLWFNAAGLNRALVFRNKLTITGSISLTASEGFTQKNLHRSHAENVEAMKKQTALHLENGVDVPRIGVMAAFGCNYQGDIAPAQVISTLEDGLRSPRRPEPTSSTSRSPIRWAGRRRCGSSVCSERCAAAGRTCRSRCTCTIRAVLRSPTRMPG